MPTRFVQVLPGELDALADELGLDFDALAVLRGLRDAADWRTGVVAGSMTELAERFRTSRKRVASALRRLEAAGVVACHFIRGHDGEVAVLAYDRLVRSARVGGNERPAETSPLASESTSGRPPSSLASESTTARVGEHEPRVVGNERPAETSPRPEEGEDPPGPRSAVDQEARRRLDEKKRRGETIKSEAGLLDHLRREVEADLADKRRTALEGARTFGRSRVGILDEDELAIDLEHAFADDELRSVALSSYRQARASVGAPS